MTALALLSPPLALVAELGDGGRPPIIAAGGALVVAVLVVVRFSALLLERERHVEILRARAELDGLTGLPNRTALERHLAERLGRPVADRSGPAILFCDLDGFKAVNDVHGHATGDAVLCTVASRLRAVAHDDDLVVRLAGDEFVIVLDDPGRVGALAALVREVVRQPTTSRAGAEVRIDVSVGTVVADLDDTDPDALLHRADVAMYRVKAAR